MSSSSTSAIYTFIFAGQVYSSPTHSNAPKAGIPEPDPQASLSESLHNLYEIRYIPNACLYAPWYPYKPHWSSTLLASLEYKPKHKIAMEERDGLYRVAHCETWQEVEHHFIIVHGVLRDTLYAILDQEETDERIDRQLFHLAQHVPNLDAPSIYPYTDFLSLDAAQDAAWRANHALNHYIACLAFFVALCKHRQEGWWWTIAVEAGCDIAFLERMRESYICDHRSMSARIGFFMFPDWVYRRFLSFFVCANVPIYINWGPRHAMYPLPSMMNQAHRPSRDQVLHVSDLTNWQLSRFPTPRQARRPPRRPHTTLQTSSTSHGWGTVTSGSEGWGTTESQRII
jgi:hypothetical protein